ncbi:MAG: ATP-binding protein [Acidobacteriaceae bacterium]
MKETIQLSDGLSWIDANQRYLVAEFARLRARLEAKPLARSEETIAEVRQMMSSPPAIDQLCDLFDLTAFEREILLLCAGVEMDSQLAGLCGNGTGMVARPAVTFGLAMATMPQPHWSALTPARPLRRYRLIEKEPGASLTSSPLRIDERILHYLAGVNLIDPALEPLLQPSPYPTWIADEHRPIAAQVAQHLLSDSQPRLLQFSGDDPQGQEDVAVLAAEQTGNQLYTLRAEDLPAPGAELDRFVVLWTREARLLHSMLLLQCGAASLLPAARYAAEHLPGWVVLASRDNLRLSRECLRYAISKPLPAEQKVLWERALGSSTSGTPASSSNGMLDNLAEQFRFSAKTIFRTAALAASGDAADTGAGISERLWNACRDLSRPRLEDLAQRITPIAGWADLVLPEMQMRMLRQLASQVRQRMTVYETWGFSAQGRRGLGVSALFAGESGTGKTLAAEVLAKDLGLDLYRIDLSAVVSKYIGETEKNLRQVFDAAEEGGVLLLFDEADALFGKRGEVKDSNDRYANIEVGYLLQRMEAYQGLAILTTNMKSSLDRSFQRRLRYTVNFPFPDSTQRKAIWARVFPAGTPTEGLDSALLSQLNVAGGNIRNIALNAAFLAAEARKPVAMPHLLEAARLESQKIERPLSDAELRGWV